MSEWVSWELRKPPRDGYYLFAMRTCGDSYSCSLDLLYEYYAKGAENYGIYRHICKEDENHFTECRAWMIPPKWPIWIPNPNTPRNDTPTDSEILRISGMKDV